MQTALLQSRTAIRRAARAVATVRLSTKLRPVTPVSIVSSLPASRIAGCRGFASPSAAAATPGAVIDFNLPDIGEGIAEVEVLQWFIKPGDEIKQFDPICEVQSDKATVPITSRYDGVVKELKYQVKDMAKVGSPLFTIQLAGGSAAAAAPKAAAAPAAAAAAAPSSSSAAAAAATELANEKVLASPAVRHLARQHNIRLSTVPATGPKGYITKQDILAFINSGGKATAAPAAPTPAAPAAAKPAAAAPVAATSPFPAYALQDQVVPISGLQRIMVQTMNASNAVPQLGYSDEIVMDELVRLRAQFKGFAEKQGIKLSYLPFIMKAVSLALRQYPHLNAHVNSDCTQLVQMGSHNIGLAMDTPRGLLVPNVKNVQDKSILEIAQELTRLAALGQEGKLGKKDLTGGTFTLSNVGTIGGTYTKPLLVVPEVMIGALGKFQTLPRFDSKGNVYPATIMVMSWSADHRVIDGASVARFSNAWKGFLERPSTMLLHTK